MNEDRKRILALLAQGRVTVDEAERLMAAMDHAPSPASRSAEDRSGAPKFLRVEVDAHESDSGKTKVNVRVPMALLRAGVRLSALIPPAARDEVNAAMAKQGVPFDINPLKPEILESLIEQLGDLTVDVDNEQAKVRVYCE